MPDYAATLWLPRTDPATFPISSSLLNKIENGLKDAAQNSKQRGLLSDRPNAGASNKNWFWIDSATEQLSYSDGTAWRNIATPVEAWSTAKCTYAANVATYASGPANVPAQIRKEASGRVSTRGEIVTSAALAVGGGLYTINDANYRPTTRQRFVIYGSNGAVMVSVDPSGSVNVQTAVASGAVLNLAALTYFTDA